MGLSLREFYLGFNLFAPRANAFVSRRDADPGWQHCHHLATLATARWPPFGNVANFWQCCHAIFRRSVRAPIAPAMETRPKRRPDSFQELRVAKPGARR